MSEKPTETKAPKADKNAVKPATSQTTREGNVVTTRLPNGLTIKNAVGAK